MLFLEFVSITRNSAVPSQLPVLKLCSLLAQGTPNLLVNNGF